MAGATLLFAGCSGSALQQSGEPIDARVIVARDLPLPERSEPLGAVLWVDPREATRGVIIGAAGPAGLTLTSLDRPDSGTVGGLVADAVALVYGFKLDNDAEAVVVAHDRAAGALRAFTVTAGARGLRERTRVPLVIGAELTGLCLYRSPVTAKVYAFASTEPGVVQQWELTVRGGVVDGRRVRDLAMGSGIAGCVADDAAQSLYLADERIGIWRVAAEPEADPADRILLARTTPHGSLGEEVKVVAIRREADRTYLLALDDEEARVHVYQLPAGVHRGAFTLAAADDPQIESLWSGFAPPPFDAGLVVVPEPDASAPRYRLLSWSTVAAALRLPLAAPLDPRVVPASSMPLVEPTVETEPVLDYGDAADDAAIWIHPRDPAQSLIIGAQKKRGIEIYDLAGRRRYALAVGRTNNVDLRQGVRLGGRQRDIVAGSNRDARTLDLYEMNPETLQLESAVAAPIATGLRDPYGVCLYHSARSGKLYAFVNDVETGEYRQWEIEPAGERLGARLVRTFTVGSQAEGCVADDETGALYVAEEDVGLWRYAAEPDAGESRRSIDTVSPGRLRADVEGLALYRGAEGSGFLIVSNQGADNYAVYRREGDNAFVGFFAIVANDALGIDGAAETDGLDVSSAALGGAFPQGLLVVQDGRNITPPERQNFKLVPWERIAAALQLN